MTEHVEIYWMGIWADQPQEPDHDLPPHRLPCWNYRAWIELHSAIATP